MDRRSFLKGILAASIISSIELEETISKIIEETISLPDNEFVTYITFIFQAYVSYPAHCAIITNIEEP